MYGRLTKSTVSLIPLLGIQYLVTGFLDTDMSDKKALFAIKAFELSFVSIQVSKQNVSRTFCLT